MFLCVCATIIPTKDKNQYKVRIEDFYESATVKNRNVGFSVNLVS